MLDSAPADGIRFQAMTSLTSAEAAERLGINAQKFHRLAARHDLAPVFEAPGQRGAKFWNPRDIERIARLLEAAT